MADVAENAQFTDPATAISQGKRHLLVRDYTMAVTVLARACEQLAEKYGDTADELGEPYLLYGRALLGLAREEAGVLGGGVPGSEETEEDEDGDEDEEADEEKLSNVDEKEEEEEDTAEEGTTNGVTSETKEQEKSTNSENKGNNMKKGTEEKCEKSDEPKVNEDKKQEKGEKVERKVADETDDSKIAEKKTQEIEKIEKGDKEKSVAGPSKNESLANGASSSTEQNGELKENGNDDSEDLCKDEEEDEVNNLQVAWEVLELAKLVLLKRGPPGWKLLADSYRLLGEVAMEGGNHQGALQDLQGCLDLLQKIEPREPRAIAEIHYQLGLAHSLANDFDASIEQFNKATKLLEARIEELEQTTEPPKTDNPFYTIQGEIQELKDLLPEIQEKITDMKDFKQEACKLVIEGIKSKVAGGCSNGAGPSNSDSPDASAAVPKVQKPASDISHLVRKKRKAEESETEVASPCKKPTPEKAV